MDLHLPQSHPRLTNQKELVTIRGARGLDGQSRECRTGEPPHNMSDVEAAQVVADVAEASPAGLSDLFNQEEWATYGGTARYVS